jgi:hypothetical protein
MNDTATEEPNSRTVTFPILRNHQSAESRTFRMSDHATRQMYARALNYEMICRALQWGTVIHSKGAAHFVVRDKDLKRRDELNEKHRGIRVVVDPDSGTVMTVYRNKGSLPRRNFPN